MKTIYFILFTFYLITIFNFAQSYYTQVCMKNDKKSQLCCGNVFRTGCKGKSIFKWLAQLLTVKKTVTLKDKFMNLGNCFASSKCLTEKTNDWDNSEIIIYFDEVEKLFTNIIYFNIHSLSLFLPFLLKALERVLLNPVSFIGLIYFLREKVLKKLEKFKNDLRKVQSSWKRCEFCNIMKKDIIILEREENNDL